MPDYPDEEPPASVVIKQSSRVIASAYGLSPPSVSADNRLGSPVVHTGPSYAPPFWTETATSDGVLYSVADGAETVSVQCAPAATASSTMFAWGSAVYRAVLTPVVCTLAGTTYKAADHTRNILIGQGCTASLGAEGYTLTDYQWEVEGDTFRSYEAHGLASGGWADTTG